MFVRKSLVPRLTRLSMRLLRPQAARSLELQVAIGFWATGQATGWRRAHQSWHGCHEFSGTCCEVLQMLFVLAKDITYKREACRPPDELRHCVP